MLLLMAQFGTLVHNAIQLRDPLDRLRAAIARGEEGEPFPWTPELMDQLTQEADEMHRRGASPAPAVCPCGNSTPQAVSKA